MSVQIGPIEVTLKASCYDYVRLRNTNVLHFLGEGDGFAELGRENVEKIPELIEDIFPYGLGITTATFEDKNQENWTTTLIPRRNTRMDHMRPNSVMEMIHSFKMPPSALYNELVKSWESDKIFVLDHYTIKMTDLYHVLPCNEKCKQILMQKDTVVMVKDLDRLEAMPEAKDELINFNYAAANKTANFVPDKKNSGKIVSIDINRFYPIEVKFSGKKTTDFFIMEDLQVFGDTKLQ